MSNRGTSVDLTVAQVMAHCGGNPAAAADHLARAIAAAPEDPEPYALLAELRSELVDVVRGGGSLPAVLAQSYVNFLDGDMDAAVLAIGSVTGARPDIAWAGAPWFGDERFLGAVSPDALAEAATRTLYHDPDLDSDSMRERFQPWFHAIEVVTARRPVPAALARMAILLRASGLTDESFALCDKADAVERIMLTEVVRAGTWRKLGDPEQTAAAFERAVALEPTSWSLHLDLADLRAEQGDFAGAVAHVDRGLRHEPAEPTLRVAAAAYRTRLTCSAADLVELIELAPLLPDDPYRSTLIDYACANPDLPADLVAKARRL
ncbi:tetratricopeptide repeat protein [Kutzneria chonburiensis]|uniref:Tetratricopeptide repeat protein n=1 Tax=Kutzneria chonburiensis TaxID=1483604 RepID=A0ABV6N3P0_9PSEU|nr:tetratricopeptide repeat protein [Kutzneria chonburiensis]